MLYPLIFLKDLNNEVVQERGMLELLILHLFGQLYVLLDLRQPKVITFRYQCKKLAANCIYLYLVFL